MLNDPISGILGFGIGGILCTIILYGEIIRRFRKVGIKDIGRNRTTKEWVILWKDGAQTNGIR